MSRISPICDCEDLGCRQNHRAAGCEHPPVIKIMVYGMAEWLCERCFDDISFRQLDNEITVIEDTRIAQ